MQNEFISRETFWIAGLLPAFLQVKSLRSFAAKKDRHIRFCAHDGLLY